MNRFLAIPACLLAVFLLSTVSLTGQVNLLGDHYDLNAFRLDSPAAMPDSYVKLDVSYRDRYLIVEADILDGWHLYSLTQPDGGSIRSEIRIKGVETPIREIRPTTAPHLNAEDVGIDITQQEHEGQIAWIVVFQDDLPPHETIRGALYAQFCRDTCIPPGEYPFEARYDADLDVESYLTVAETVPKEFTWHSKAEKTSIHDTNDVTSTEAILKGGAVPESFTPQEVVEVNHFGMVLLYAFLGGLILNVMPCVLPVIGLKILSFFEQAGKSRARAFYLNVWYSLGLLSVFLFLAGMSYGLSKLFSFDLFSIVMACVVFAMALSLMDVWEISMPGFLGSGTSMKLTQQEGAVGAFFKGIITTLLAIPCGAPLLSPAVNWANVQIHTGNTGLVFIAYGMIGLGMASPYLIVGAFPELLRFLPKPGDWMETFKKAMGYCLLVAVVWILYFIRLERMLPTVAFLFALWFACWMVGRLEYTANRMQRVKAWTISLAVLFFVLLVSFDLPLYKNPYNLESAMKAKLARAADISNPDVHHNHWKLYTPQRFEEAMMQGKPVVVDFTADWCMNCKALEQAVLETKPILDKMDEKGVVSFMADRTNEGDASAFLLKLGGDIVPTLAIFNPKEPDKPIILRGGYTQRQLLAILDQL